MSSAPRTCVFLLLLLSIATSAFALDLTGQSRTYFQSGKQEDSTRYQPLFEYLSFRADDIGTRAVSFHVGGWYGHDFGNANYDDTKRSTGDLQYAFLSIRRSTGNAYVNLGRIMVTQGQASSQLDGAAFGTDLMGGFGISAFGGIPLETAYDSRDGDSVYGGRISQGIDGLYRIGVSYLREKNNSVDFRKEEGVDLWLRPVGKVELLGSSLYNGLTSAFARHAYYLTLGPFSALTLRTQFTEISYKDFFTSPTLNVFELQPGGPIDPNEKLRLIGEEASFVFSPVIFSADYKQYTYDVAGSAQYYGARLAYSGVQNTAAGLSVHRMSGQTNNLKYYEYRLYGHRNFGRADVAADLLSVAYAEEINGIKTAYSASLACGYALTTRARLGADVEYARTPYLDRDVRGLVKLIYNFDIVPGAGGRQ